MSARAIRIIVFAAGAAFVAMWLVLAYLRLVYPYDVEWMEGAMMDHAMRIVDGQPIYTAPTIHFVAWLYPPLYYYAVALAIKIFGASFFAGRIVSILSTLVTAAMLAAIVQRITRKRSFAFLTIALYLASYAATGFYFDIVRNDAFFTMLLVAAACAALLGSGNMAAIVSAIILSLAFLTKQQAIFFFPAIALWFWLRSRQSAMLFAVITIAVTGTALLLWNRQTDGWLFFYLFSIPHAKQADFSWLRALDVLPKLILTTFLVCTIAAFVTFAMRSRKGSRSIVTRPEGLLLLASTSGLLAAAISLGNDGGYANVFMPCVVFIVTLLPVAAHQVQERWPAFAQWTWLAFLFQFGALLYNPGTQYMVIASAHQRAGGSRFMAQLKQMPGEIYMPYHGFLNRMAGKASYSNILAFSDVLMTQDTTAHRLQRDLDSAFAQHRFSAVIMDECPLLSVDSIAHYSLEGRMFQEPNVMLSRFGSERTRPQYLFLPK